jgi:hypothetical protein
MSNFDPAPPIERKRSIAARASAAWIAPACGAGRPRRGSTYTPPRRPRPVPWLPVAISRWG